MQTIEWSPSKNLICCGAFPPQKIEGGAKHEQWGKMHLIDLTDMPNRKEMKWKTITWAFNACKIQWDNTGNKIIVIFNKLKNKRSSTVIQIADLTTQTIAIEEHEFNDVKCVNLDDNAKRIAVVSIDPSNSKKFF